MRKLIDLVESYAGAFNTRGKTCEVFRNPTAKEFRECGSEIRAFLVGDDVLMWNAYSALHQEVRENLKLPTDSISLEIWSEGYGKDCDVSVTDNTERTSWYHNPEIVGEIRGNAGLSSMFDHISIYYFDEAIVGPWDEIEEEEDELVEGSDHVPPQYDADDEDHYTALHQTGFFGAQAAGCLPFCPETGRVMIVLRSQGVEQPGTWGNVGGAHHASETPEDAARREFFEETGYSGPVKLEPLLVFKKDSFRYCNFLAIVHEEFVPHLGWEADDYKWLSLEEAMRAPLLHFGLQSLFADAASVATIKSHMGDYQ